MINLKIKNISFQIDFINDILAVQYEVKKEEANYLVIAIAKF